MKNSLSQKGNLNFWETQAKRFKSHRVSWWDVNMKQLEIKQILPWLKKNDRVLDVGCSNGAATLEIQKVIGCKIDGIDYSPLAIKQAGKIKNKHLSFKEGDIVNFKSAIKYNKIFTQRCLINIMSAANQKKALINIHDSLKPGGLFIMEEAFYGGLINFNKARKFFGLAPLKQPKHNLYFREKQFEKFVKKYFKIIKIEKYASLYYLGTRLFQYLALSEEPKGRNVKVCSFFSNYDCSTKYSGDFAPQKLYILKKK